MDDVAGAAAIAINKDSLDMVVRCRIKSEQNANIFANYEHK